MFHETPKTSVSDDIKKAINKVKLSGMMTGLYNESKTIRSDISKSINTMKTDDEKFIEKLEKIERKIKVLKEISRQRKDLILFIRENKDSPLTTFDDINNLLAIHS